jgi:transmembrane sensor
MELKDNRDLEVLLNKYSEGELTDEEKRQLSDLLNSTDNEKRVLKVLSSELREYNEDNGDNDIVDFDHIYKNISFKIKQRKILEAENRKIIRRDKIRRIFVQISSIAAVFIFAFFLGSTLQVIDHKKSTVLENNLSYSEIKTPFGAKSKVTLSDGTQVMLNAGSILKYGNDFNSDNRNLVLEGEAYFKVAKNADLPLIVNAGNISIKAVGTEFNVKAYKDEGVIETTLIEGSVEILENAKDNRINTLFDLKPNQKAIYIKESNLLTINSIKDNYPLAAKPAEVINDKILISPKVDVNQVVAWTQNQLIIKSESLEDISIKLQRKYDVRIIFGDNNIKSYRFSGVLEDEPIEQVLDAIKLTAPISFLIDGKTVLLLSNKDQTARFSKSKN